MARSRRRPTRRRRVRTDWVYRGNTWTLAEPQVQVGTAGTYNDLAGGVKTQVIGIGNAQSLVLLDSSDFYAELAMQGNISAAAGNPVMQTGEARAEKRRQVVRAVEGLIHVEPATWAIGNNMYWCFRLGIWEQTEREVFSLDPNYSAWTDTSVAFNNVSVGHYANMKRTNLKEWRIMEVFNSNLSFWNIRVRWRGRRVLEPHECFGIYSEGGAGSVNIRYHTYLRTLVEVRD